VILRKVLVVYMKAEQDRRYTCDVKLRRFCATIAAGENEQILHVVYVCL
jgi:hypothetical protein